MGLRDIGSTLPPGFRFYPSDEELVCHYLYKKVTNERVSGGTTMVEVDLHTREPWELPEVAKLSADEWYFFSFRDRKYATGSRSNRSTRCGYWKATGKDRIVHEPTTQAVVGMRKTLVFYRGRAPNGTKTGWVMHEFRLDNPHMPPKEDWVLCRVFHKRKGETTARCALENDQDKVDPSSPRPQMDQLPTADHTDCRLLEQQLNRYAGEHRCEGESSSQVNYDFFDLPVWHYNVDFPPETGGASAVETGAASSEDDYGLLLDVGELGGMEFRDVEGKLFF